MKVTISGLRPGQVVVVEGVEGGEEGAHVVEGLAGARDWMREHYLGSESAERSEPVPPEVRVAAAKLWEEIATLQRDDHPRWEKIDLLKFKAQSLLDLEPLLRGPTSYPAAPEPQSAAHEAAGGGEEERHEAPPDEPSKRFVDAICELGLLVHGDQQKVDRKRAGHVVAEALHAYEREAREARKSAEALGKAASFERRVLLALVNAFCDAGGARDRVNAAVEALRLVGLEIPEDAAGNLAVLQDWMRDNNVAPSLWSLARPQAPAHEPAEASPAAPPAAVPEAPASAPRTATSTSAAVAPPDGDKASLDAAKDDGHRPAPILLNRFEVDMGGSIPTTLVCPHGASFEVGRLMTVEIVMIEKPGDGAAGLVRAHVVLPDDAEGLARRCVLTAIGHLASAARLAAGKSHEERMRVVTAATEAFALVTGERPSMASRDARAEALQIVRELLKRVPEATGGELEFTLPRKVEALVKLWSCLR